MDRNSVSARQAAVISVTRMEKEGRYSNLELDSTLKKYGLTGAEKNLYTKLLYGVLERKITLDYLLSKLSSIPVEKLECEVRNILRVGLYQLLFLERIPKSAACNEAVKLAARRNPRAKGFVNAVMRSASTMSFSDEMEALRKAKKDDREYLSVRYSVSKELAELLSVQYGTAKAESMLSASFESGNNISLRVNTLKTDRASLTERLGAYNAVPSPLCDDCIRISGNFSVEGCPEFDEGSFFVQSEPSCICAKTLGAKRGDHVIDACACPGGKTFSIAINMENDGELFAFDLHKNKLSLIEKGARRLGIDIVQCSELDGRCYVPEYERSFDAVLCDVPCSGFGTLAKKPEIRYKEMNRVNELPNIQLAILNNNSCYVKEGGTLLYSTCTINKNENGEVAKRFLEMHGDFEAVDIDTPEGTDTVKDGVGVCFLPCNACCDGFYIAKFRRKTY